MSLELPDLQQTEEDYKQFYSSNPYEVLGISEFSDLENINKARKELLKRFHPDTNDDPRATEIAQNINNAYNVIKNMRTPHTSPSSGNESYKRTNTPNNQEAEKETAEEKMKKMYEDLDKDFDALQEESEKIRKNKKKEKEEENLRRLRADLAKGTL